MERTLRLLLLVGLCSALGSACQCPEPGAQEVCGSDLVTYPSHCALQCAQENTTGLALLHEGPCEATEAKERGRFLRDISCATEAAKCQKKCGSSIRISFSCQSNGKSDCSCLPGTGTCDDEKERCRVQCAGGLYNLKCSYLHSVVQTATCTCHSIPSPIRPDCSAYASSCEKTCGSQSNNFLCHLDHETLLKQSCTCGTKPNSAHRTQVALTSALACLLLWMTTWMTC